MVETSSSTPVIQPLLGTGYNLFAQDDNPSGVDWLQTTPNSNGAMLVQPHSLVENIRYPLVKLLPLPLILKDEGDNQFDSMAFFDNLRFSGYAKTQILARKTVTDINGGLVQCEDIVRVFDNHK